MALLVVEPLYPESGKNWLDYVGGGDPYAEVLSRPDTPCDYVYADDGVDNPRYHACAHGGEMRRAVTTFPTCEVLKNNGHNTYGDDLAAFRWTCKDQNGFAVLMTSGLEVGKNLSDLIDFATLRFRPNRLVIRQDGVVLAASAPAIWWANPVVEASTGNTELTFLGTSGTLYVVRSNATTDGFNITAPRVGLVVAPGVTLSYSGSGNKNCGDKGIPSPPADGVYACFVAANSQPFLWLEGQFVGDTGPVWPVDVLTLYGTRFSVLRHVSARHGWTSSIWIDGSTNNLLVDVTTTGCAGQEASAGGLMLIDSHGNELRDVQVNNNAKHGLLLLGADWNSITNLHVWLNGTAALGGTNIRLETSHHNRLVDVVTAASIGEGLAVVAGSVANVITNVRASSNGSEAVWLYDPETRDNTVTQVTCTANGLGCVLIGNGASNNTVSHVTAANGGSAVASPTSGVGMSPQQQTGVPAQNTFNQIAVVNGYGPGVHIDGDKGTVSQVVVASCAVGVELVIGNHSFLGNLLLGNNGVDCSPGWASGLDGACLGPDVTYHPKSDMAAAFFGKALTDRYNPNATGGTQLFGSIFNWSSFENLSRGWGGSGDAFPSITNQVPCAEGATCQIWDWRLKAADVSALRNLSGNGATPNEPFVRDQTCPSAVHGDVALTDSQTAPQTFLVNALEMVGDLVGDDDGLCESKERCIYSPNFGAYQGEGDPWANGRCLFSNGTTTAGVVDVLMYAYPVNGAL